MILCTSLLLLSVSLLSPTNAQDHPVCEVCGCSFCPEGLVMENPTVDFTIPEEYRSSFFGLETIPCQTIEELGLGGQVPPDLCSDDLRLFEDFRTTCGCPIVSPPTPGPPATDDPAPSPPTAFPSIPTDEPSLSQPTDFPSAEFVSPPPTPETSEMSDPTISPSDPPTPLPTLLHTFVPTMTSYPTLSVEKCEICGEGVSMRALDAIYKIPKEVKEQFQGLDKVECKDLEDLASGGVFKEFAFVCSDEFRLRRDFRSTCGCDDEEEPAPPTTCEICGCSKCDDGNKMSNRDAQFNLESPMTIPSEGLSPVSMVPCGLLEDVAYFGDMESGLSEYLCDDSFRLDQTFREICGCPEIAKGKKNKEKESKEEEDGDDDEKPDGDKDDEGKMNKRMDEDDDDHEDDEKDHDQDDDDEKDHDDEDVDDDDEMEDGDNMEKEDKEEDDDDGKEDGGKKDKKGSTTRVRRKDR